MTKWILVLAILQSCVAAKNGSQLKMKNFDKQGHRGCRGLMPENTVDAMITALDKYNVTTLELDVCISADGKVVLSHEPFMNHEIATKPDGTLVTEAEEKSLNMYTMTYDSIKKYDVGLRPHPRFQKQEKRAAIKPLLEDVFTAVKQYCKEKNRALPWFNIETKCMPATDNIYHPAPEKFVDLLMAVVKANDMEKHINIQSFDFRTLQYAHKQYPKIPLAALVEESDSLSLNEQIEKLGFAPYIYSPHYSLVDVDLVIACKSKYIKLIPWTVNDKMTIDQLKKLRVDGIITDYPNLFAE